ncbi:MAG: FAD-dependent thymidylate synthase [Synergistaceae bacterium]|nr:FAD-dependent thymidylate synthase [Synergistaceae bacterium]MBQ3625594.1 FAD-dependent thymidylate synthase [Synergistaceae bacterium]MBQ9581839.1 FAD-dependent thymidylate synthase [Synergistaceae bacterium]MBQ9896241.1 FAD-dependent thymidylate synthase [Synergistaceae bacterium]MBR0044211.1 FAD-dependent thymidylate synthase [Synergistaceae bacterium]
MIEIIKMSAELIGEYEPLKDLIKIERMARNCYNSPLSESSDARNEFIIKLVKAGHESVIEHVSVSFMLTVPRSISHQIVRHRIGVAYSQQSQRYIDLSKEPLKVIAPVPELDANNLILWRQSVEFSAEIYNKLIASGVRPQQARSVLPNCTAAKLGMTANLRAWRHILKERYANTRADPAIREVMSLVAEKLKEMYPPVFEDI